MSRTSYGKKDGSKKGFKQGGRGKNKTDTCRHPEQNKK